jgi:nucleoside-diphosphate-sugar epimerase
MKILVTGGAGFLGINMIRFLLNKGYTDIVSLDMAGFDYPEKNKVTVISGDIRDKQAVAAA